MTYDELSRRCRPDQDVLVERGQNRVDRGLVAVHYAANSASRFTCSGFNWITFVLLRLTERFRRLNFGRMDLDVTVDDPKAYSRTWKSDTIHLLLQPDAELLEHLCENNRDADALKQYWEGRQQAAPPATGKQ